MPGHWWFCCRLDVWNLVAKKWLFKDVSNSTNTFACPSNRTKFTPSTLIERIYSSTTKRSKSNLRRGSLSLNSKNFVHVKYKSLMFLIEFVAKRRGDVIRSRTFYNLPELSITFQNFLAFSKIFQSLLEPFIIFQKLLWYSKTFHSLPNSSRIFHNLPKLLWYSKTFRSLRKLSIIF